MSIEVLNIKRKIAAIGVVVGTLGIAGCSNYEGKGNDFDVTIAVEESTHQSITGHTVEVRRADGEAADWFAVLGDVDEFHDNCDCDGLWRSRKQYGEVRNIKGDLIKPGTLSVGQCIAMQGKIRVDFDGETNHTRPVYEVAQVVPCG